MLDVRSIYAAIVLHSAKNCKNWMSCTIYQPFFWHLIAKQCTQHSVSSAVLALLYNYISCFHSTGSHQKLDCWIAWCIA